MESPIIIIYPTKYPNDSLTFTIESRLQKEHPIDFKGIITTYGDFEARKQRVLYTKGRFLFLGLDISVGVVSDYHYKSI